LLCRSFWRRSSVCCVLSQAIADLSEPHRSAVDRGMGRALEKAGREARGSGEGGGDAHGGEGLAAGAALEEYRGGAEVPGP
jgi:hypothetical protein